MSVTLAGAASDASTPNMRIDDYSNYNLPPLWWILISVAITLAGVGTALVVIIRRGKRALAQDLAGFGRVSVRDAFRAGVAVSGAGGSSDREG